LVLIGIPLTYNISHGMALGFVSYPIMKLFSGRVKEVHPIMWALAAVFAVSLVLSTRY